MKDFFQVTDLNRVLEYQSTFTPVGTEKIAVADAWRRIVAEPITATQDLPGFSRSTMDGYCVRAADTFGIEVVARGQVPGSLHHVPDALGEDMPAEANRVAGQVVFVDEGFAQAAGIEG